MKLMPVGIDIAKMVFQVHYVDEETGEIVNKPVKRAAFLEHFTNRTPCRVGIERAAVRTTGRENRRRWVIRSS